MMNAQKRCILPEAAKKQPLTSGVLAGPKRDDLYVTKGDSVHRHKLAVD